MKLSADEKNQKRIKIYLKRGIEVEVRLKRDYMVNGTAISRDFVDFLTHDDEAAVLWLNEKASIDRNIALPMNTTDVCIQIWLNFPCRATLIPADFVQRIEQEEHTHITLTYNPLPVTSC